MAVMMGRLIAALDEPRVTQALIEALDAPALSRRLAAAAAATGREPAELAAAAVRGFLDTASDDHWLQLLGIMGRAEDPGLAGLRAILEKALPDGAAA